LQAAAEAGRRARDPLEGYAAYRRACAPSTSAEDARCGHRKVDDTHSLANSAQRRGTKLTETDNQLHVAASGNDFPITLTARSQGFKTTFSNSSEVREFLLSEQQWWNELQRTASVSSTWRDALAQAGQHAVAHALKRFGPVTDASAGDTLSVLSPYAASGPLLRGGRQGKRLQALAENVPGAVPILALAEAVRMQPALAKRVPNVQLTTVDLVNALAGMSHDIRSPVVGERSKLESLLSEADGLESRLAALHADFSAWDEKQRALWDTERASFVQESKDTLKQGTERLELHLAQTDARLDSYFAESIEQTESFKKRVREDVVLAVPTAFWDKKASGHLRAAVGSGAAFALVAGAGVWLLAAHGISLVSSAFHTVGTLPSDSALLALVPLAFITIPALAFAWVLRHISRVLIQNLSLGADARLRATITSTFKVLASDRDMSEAELAIALQALFRPIEVKDHAEIAPPSLAELLKINDK